MALVTGLTTAELLAAAAGAVTGAGLFLFLLGLRGRPSAQAAHARTATAPARPSPSQATLQPDAVWAELARRLGADEAAAQMLNAGLRYLGRALNDEGRTPPTVFAVHVGEVDLDIWVAPGSHDAPEPWYAVGDGQVWRLALADTMRLDLGQLGTLAPYPGLVPIGRDATGRVLVDLAAARGVIAVTGPGELVADALSAMATELATSPWADEIHLTLVGAGEDLAVLAPDRVHLAATMAEALSELEARAPAVPHYLITLVSPSGAEQERLLALARTGRSVAAGYLVAGKMPGATWTWEVTADGRLRAPQLGLDVAAQLIPHEQQETMAEPAESADDLEGVLMSAPPVEAAPVLASDAVVPVEVALLGPVWVSAAREIEPDLLPLATEIVVYLATHPGGVHPNVLAAAIWPRGVADGVRDAALTRVQAWLGSDDIGRPHLAADTSGQLRLGSGVKVDWHAFRTLVAQAEQAAGGAWEEARLAQALNLVTGPFLAGMERSRYAWIVTDGLEKEVATRVGDATHRLCKLRLANGDAEGAMEAARTGLRLVPDDELLWRDLLTAGHATGHESLLRAAASEVWARASVDGLLPGMSPETEALLDELLPTWRWTLA